MKIKGFTLILVYTLILLGCKEDNFLESEEIMISLTESVGIGANNGESWIYAVELPYFDISSYPNIRSVVMTVNNIRTRDASGNDVTGKGSFELYDITNDKPIANSIIESDDTEENSYKASANFINDMPGERIKLGIRISSNGDYTIDCSHIYLILSR